MSNSSAQLLQDQRTHLAGLIEAIQRCTYFLNASASVLSVQPLGLDFANEFDHIVSSYK